MITPQGYSQDPSLVPEGIVITFGKDMIQDQGGLLFFIRGFEDLMAKEGQYWQHKCRLKPRMDEHLQYVYIIVCNQVRYRVLYGGYETGESVGWTMDGRKLETSWPRIILAGPFVKAPEKIYRSGFRGFRYCTKLF